VTYPIPGNDDAVKSIRIILETVVEAIQAGLSQRDSRRISQGKQQLADVVPVAAPVQPMIPGETVQSSDDNDASAPIPNDGLPPPEVKNAAASKNENDNSDSQ
jgi:small subunit ribosomal protein S2